ncbi:MAG: winged helix-turn-helix domain-containing protein [Hyphomicrobiales bacterium]
MKPFELGEWRVDPRSREFRSNGLSIRVSPKAMQVLQTLVGARGDVIRRDEILDAVWADVIVGEEVLTHAIAELRRALDDRARSPRFIETVHKAGYRLCARPKACAPDCTEAGERLRSDFDLDWYRECLRGRVLFERGGKHNMHAAVEAYRTAAEYDPASPLGLAELAETLTFLYLYYEPHGSHLEAAFRAAETAISLEPDFALAHAVHGFILAIRGRRAPALGSFGAALRHQPNGFSPHYLLGRAMYAAGDMATAAALLDRAAQVKPQDFHALVIASAAYRGSGDCASATRASRAALARIDAHLQANPGDMRALCGKACCLVELGDAERALETVRDASPADDPLQYYLVDSLARAGEIDGALDALERVIEGGWAHADWLQADPDIANLRREPRFKRMQRALELH